MFCVVVELKECRSSDGSIITNEGDKALLVNDDFIDATARHIHGDKPSSNDLSQMDIKTFKDVNQVDNFLEGWEGHPWYHKFNGNYDVYEIKKNYKTIQHGYKLKDT